MEVKCTFTEMVDIDLLVPNPRNANKHPDEQIKLLAKIMKHQGWRSPVVVSKRSGFIVKGHGRLMAAKLNGWTSAPVDCQEYATEADEYADMVADNKIAELSETDMAMVNLDAASFPDLDLDLLGIPDFSLIDPEVLEPGCDEDEVPEHVEPRTKLGDIYKLGNHRLMCGDSTSIDAVEKLMNGEKADMVFTDPPYGMFLDTDFSSANVNKRSRSETNLSGGGTYDRVIGDGDDFTPDLINSVFASFPEAKEVFLWGADYYADILPDRNAGSWIVWDKRCDENFDKVFGSGFELCWSKTRHKRELARIRAGVFGVKDDSKKRVHPTQKPVQLAEWFFTKFGDGLTAVADVYGGSGSTLIACEKTNRKAYLMELDPKYCDVIVARWEKYTGKKAELING